MKIKLAKLREKSQEAQQLGRVHQQLLHDRHAKQFGPESSFTINKSMHRQLKKYTVHHPQNDDRA